MQGALTILPGFPRTVAQAKDLDGCYNIDTVLNLDVPFETIVDRISVSYLTKLHVCILCKHNVHCT